ncbi:cysteine proteinase [Hesseltinella vesiculosa]|uniref:ubiquitinyl hydrolase 1 n=1 Tax=Hesseltinella vesiculosa TaxID=101127 RepID=A0A1X2GX52_9FUNG|nr:cysteine proteinase [Hesseltinella vesiculosa]
MTQEQNTEYEIKELSNELTPSQPVSQPEASVISEWKHVAEKELLAIDEEVLEFKVFHWEISDWNALPDRIQGPVFEVGGHRWNVLLFPRGNNTQGECVSIYLEYTDAKTGPPENYACAQFVICVSRPSDPTAYSVHSGQHRFQADESDWGFTRFVEMQNLETNYLESNAVRISVIVKVVKDPNGVLWHNFLNYDSKAVTGHVGLKNQGATCYMNSLFQSLYCTNLFRKAVYQIPTESDNPSKSVSLALQRLFYNLQFTNSPVGTNELTKSFGWDTLDAFMQHDVQEFNRVLQDNLEIKMKGTPADGAIKKLFLGRMKSYIRCINVNYESSRSEDYYDIQLNVKGCANLEASFKDYIAEEVLEGDNKYMAEGYGLQDAKKGVIFESFPPVLHLQLKRFEYNIMTDRMVKINDRHEFPLSIDLEPYLSESADKSMSHEYCLHGVLVHSGDLGGGHYLAFVKPTKEDGWLKFDDDRVIPATLKEVLEENFGGEPINAANNPRPHPRNYKRYTNAYMLVYVRKCMLDEILAPVTDSDIPKHLVQRLEEERLSDEKRRREKEQQHLYMETMIATDADFENNHGLDFLDFAVLPRFKVRKDQTYGAYKQELANQLGLPVSQFRPWVLVNRQNRTIRPDTPLTDEEAASQLDELRQRHSSTQTNLRLYIEKAPEVDKDGKGLFPLAGAKHPPYSLVFIKVFDPWTQDVHGAGHMYIHADDKVDHILPAVRRMAGLDESAGLDLYEEIKPEMVEIMDVSKSFSQSEIQDGDIIVAQKSLTAQEAEELQSKGLSPTVADFMNYLRQRRVLQFIPKDGDVNSIFDMEVLTTMTYDMVTQRLGAKIGADPNKIMLHLATTKDDFKPITRFPLPHGTYGDLEKDAYRFGGDNSLGKLGFEVLDVSLTEFENNRQIKVICLTPTLADAHETVVFVPKNGRVSELLRQVEANGIKFQSEHGSRQVRVYDTVSHKVSRALMPNDPVSAITDSPMSQLYIEEVPLEETKSTGDEDVLINVFHFQRDITRSHSVPFKFLVIKDEPMDDTKRRLQARTGMSDKDWAKVKTCIVSQYSATPIEEDDFKLSDHQWQKLDDTLGLEHIDKTGRANRNGTERGLTIRG